MGYKPALYLRYILQGMSLVFFVYLSMALLYPITWHAEVLQWLSRLDPWLLLSDLRWHHSIPSWTWLSMLTLVVTMLWGRVFCGWLCPFGALFTLTNQASRAIFGQRYCQTALEISRKLQMSRSARYLWLLFLAVVFIMGSNWVLFFTPFPLFSHEITRISMGAFPWLLVLIVIGTLFFSRLWCSVICPTGVLLSFAAQSRLFRYQITGNCIQCGKCEAICRVGAYPAETGWTKEWCLTCGDCQRICWTGAVTWGRSSRWSAQETGVHRDIEGEPNHSRRQFLRISIAIAAAVFLWNAAIGLSGKILRPPGALREDQFTEVCNRCGRCIKVCPNNALRAMPVTAGLACFDTPYMIPRQANCILCMACQEVCPTMAIEKVPLEQIKMGTAQIDKKRCLAWNGNDMCFVCGEICPVLAVEGDDQHKPEVRREKCVGCGTCENACPVLGEAAIRVLPP